MLFWKLHSSSLPCTHTSTLAFAFAILIAALQPTTAHHPQASEPTHNHSDPPCFIIKHPNRKPLTVIDPRRALRTLADSVPRLLTPIKYQNRPSTIIKTTSHSSYSPLPKSTRPPIVRSSRPLRSAYRPNLPTLLPTDRHSADSIKTIRYPIIRCGQTPSAGGRTHLEFENTVKRKEPMALSNKNRINNESDMIRSNNQTVVVGAKTAAGRAGFEPKRQSSNGCSNQYLDELFSMDSPGVDLLRKHRGKGLKLPEAFQGRWRLVRNRSGNVEPILEALGMNRVKRRVVAGYDIVDDATVSQTSPPILTNKLTMPFNNKRVITFRLDCQMTMIKDADFGNWNGSAGVVDNIHFAKMKNSIGRLYDARIVFDQDPEGIHPGRVQLHVWIFIPIKTGKVISVTNWWYLQP